MPDKSITPPSTSDNSLNPVINHIDNDKIWVKFDRRCFKQEKLKRSHKGVIHIYILYEMNLWPFTAGKDLPLGNSLFRAVESWTLTFIKKFALFVSSKAL